MDYDSKGTPVVYKDDIDLLLLLDSLNERGIEREHKKAAAKEKAKARFAR